MKKGFTLAEVLITLAIIGVVAALTIPTLIQKHQEKVMTTKVKKAYSVFSQAYEFAVMNNGTPDKWGMTYYNDVEGNVNMFNAFEPYIKFTKVCESNNTDDCFRIGDGNFINKTKNAILLDGSKVYMFGRAPNCGLNIGPGKQLGNICGDITIQLTDESHVRFWLTKYGIIPKGTEDTNADYHAYTFERCLEYSNSFSSIAESCAAWMVINGNMDFLHCKDLSWDGKTSCK